MTTTLQLPNAIEVDGKWTKDIELDEMTGTEEDILADQTRAPGGKGAYARTGSQRITAILSRCTVAIGDKRRLGDDTRLTSPDFFRNEWARAFSSDRIFALVRLREYSIGSLYTFPDNCPQCKKEIKVSVSLDDLQVREVKLDEASVVEHPIVLPKSGAHISWKYLRGEVDEEAVDEVMRTKKAEFVTAIFFRKIAKVEGSKPGNADFLRTMSVADRRFLATHMDMHEGGIDTDIQITCDGCNSEFTKKLEVMKGSFFFPTEIPSPDSSTNANLPSGGGGAQKRLPASPSPNGG